MMRRFYKFYRNYRQCINGAIIGLVLGLMFVILGIFKTLVIAACIFVGFFLGKKVNEDKDFFKKLLDRILPPGMYR